MTMPKSNTTNGSLNYPFPTTAPMTLLGLVQYGLVTDDAEPASQNRENQENQVGQRAALSTILTSVLDILNDEDDMFLGAAVSANRDKNTTTEKQ